MRLLGGDGLDEPAAHHLVSLAAGRDVVLAELDRVGLDLAVRLDLDYVENWSLMRDLMIIAKTVKTVLTADGAY